MLPYRPWDPLLLLHLGDLWDLLVPSDPSDPRRPHLLEGLSVLWDLPHPLRLYRPWDRLRLLRLAAILHDVGHCFFSHLSESYYGRTPEMARLIRENPVFSGAQPHEIFGFIIINTPTFRRFFAEETDFPLDGEDAAGLLETVGRMIVGAPVPLREENGRLLRPAYLTDMINGRFDADSLDYLRRDTYATGLALTYHIDRVLYKLCLADREITLPDGRRITERHLTVPVSGISTVEEMVFSKLMLTRYIYQHQKVIAVESLVGDVVAGMRYNGRLHHPCDFLYFCDADILALGMNSADPAFSLPASSFRLDGTTDLTTGKVIRRILERDLPKKAMLINRGVLCGAAGSGSAASKEDLSDAVTKMLAMTDLRTAVCDRAAETARRNAGARDIRHTHFDTEAQNVKKFRRCYGRDLRRRLCKYVRHSGPQRLGRRLLGRLVQRVCVCGDRLSRSHGHCGIPRADRARHTA